MKRIGKLCAAFIMAWAGMADIASAYDCQSINTAIGDEDVLTLAGFTFARPFEFDFAPTNAPAAGVYAAEFQLVYINDDAPRANADNMHEIIDTGLELTGYLTEFLEDQYRGAEYEELLTAYFDGSVAADLQKNFPEYMSARMQEDGIRDADSIHYVTVKMSARGKLKSALLEKHR